MILTKSVYRNRLWEKQDEKVRLVGNTRSGNVFPGPRCTPTVDGDRIVVTPGGAKGALVALDKKTGEMVWAEKEKIGKGAVSFADGMLYFREERSGAMVLVKAAPTGYSEKGRFAPPDRAIDMAWPHPVIAHGKLYLRDRDNLFCYDLKAR